MVMTSAVDEGKDGVTGVVGKQPRGGTAGVCHWPAKALKISVARLLPFGIGDAAARPRRVGRRVVARRRGCRRRQRRLGRLLAVRLLLREDGGAPLVAEVLALGEGEDALARRAGDRRGAGHNFAVLYWPLHQSSQSGRCGCVNVVSRLSDSGVARNHPNACCRRAAS